MRAPWLRHPRAASAPHPPCSRAARAGAFDGYFARSDHFFFFTAGVPVLVASGIFEDARRRDRYFGDRYHKPGDEPDSGGIRFDGAAEDVALAVRFARMVGQARGRPRFLDAAEQAACRAQGGSPPARSGDGR